MIPTFLKWVGGKRRLINKLEFPKKIERYFEPFLGAGSVFFYIKQKYNPKFCMISDINKDLINTFKAVKNHPKRLMDYLYYFKKRNSKKFYYFIRKRFNENKIKGIRRCAAFIYLNKTCYNGIYRVNSKNEFNVPYGKYKNPEIYNKETIMSASELLKGVKINCCDYRHIKDHIKKEDFVYLDPCYDPIKKTSFANYTPKRFCKLDRVELAKFIEFIENKNTNFLLSNNNLPGIKNLYCRFNIKKILSSRCISSVSYGRGKVIELAINNYPTEFNVI